MELGKKIRQLRFKANLTQEQLANKVGVAPQSVSKWENDVAMPDITTLPLIAEVFGVSIDDLFDLTTEQRFNRIENRLDMEEDLPQDVFWDYEEFLKGQLSSEANKKRALDLITYLYWHKMNAYGHKVSKYAKEAIRLSPGEKGCQWMLGQAERDAVWDWNVSNHTNAIDFYREVAEANPDLVSPYYYLLDNLLADHRADEAEQYLNRLSELKDVNPVIVEVYRAHIALARFDEKEADRIIESLVEKNPEDFACLFETAQYYAKKCDYDKAIDYYEKAYEKQPRHPRFQDELMGIADIYQIRGDYQNAARTYDRIIDLLQNEWKLTEEVELKDAISRKNYLLSKIK